MKRLFFIALILLLVVTSCSQKQDRSDNATKEKKILPLTSIVFVETEHNFGIISEGEKVSHIFKFKNTGKNPLVVSQVQPSCGCTAPDWTTEPVAPGAEGSVHVLFNSQGREGLQHKSVTVVSNTSPATNQLVFTAEVEPKKK